MHTFHVRVPVGQTLSDETVQAVEAKAGAPLHITEIRADGAEHDMYILEATNA